MENFTRKFMIVACVTVLMILGAKTPVLSSMVWTNTGSDSRQQENQTAPEENLPAPSDKASYIAWEKEIHRQVNEYRKSQNLPPLEWSDEISEQARKHSQQMASGHVPFSHQGFEQRMKAIGDKLSARKGSENVATNRGHQDPIAAAVQGWIQSSGHRENMKGEYNTTGIGVAKNPSGGYYFTQIFILKR